jgi:hypothetical protein
MKLSIAFAAPTMLVLKKRRGAKQTECRHPAVSELTS